MLGVDELADGIGSRIEVAHGRGRGSAVDDLNRDRLLGTIGAGALDLVSECAVCRGLVAVRRLLAVDGDVLRNLERALLHLVVREFDRLVGSRGQLALVGSILHILVRMRSPRNHVAVLIQHDDVIRHVRRGIERSVIAR